MNVEAPWESIQRMDKQTLQIVGTVILIAGLVLGSIGAHRIVTNLPISDEEGLAEASRVLRTQKGAAARQEGESLRRSLEFQVWKSALQVTNKVRKEERVEGTVFLVSGIISLIWAITVLYNSSSTPDDA